MGEGEGEGEKRGGSKARDKRPGTRLKFGCYHNFPTIILQEYLKN